MPVLEFQGLVLNDKEKRHMFTQTVLLFQMVPAKPAIDLGKDVWAA